MITAVEVYRSLPRYLAARLVSGRAPALAPSGPLAPVRLRHRDPMGLPGPDWVAVRPLLSGICGSDLATLTGRSSLYFTALVSMPFTPGHEVVGELLADCGELPAGSRVVLDPLLTCAARGLAPCPNCAAGQRQRCDSVATGHLSPGLQTGYCADTGGGWSTRLVAHRSQLHAVPVEVSDEAAVLTEPLACALHAAARAEVPAGGSVCVVGAGVVGLLTILALRHRTPAGAILAVAKHPRQVAWARAFGATEVLSPDGVIGGVRRATGAFQLVPERGGAALLGGVDVAVDAAGSAASLAAALRLTRAGGRVVLAGMPAGAPDVAPAWFRELSIAGTYAGGPAPGGEAAFPAALALGREHPLAELVGARYPLSRWREAIDHALAAGRLGTAKIVFAPSEQGSGL